MSDQHIAHALDNSDMQERQAKVQDHQPAAFSENSETDNKSKDLRPLAGLVPFIMAYKGRVAWAFLMLILAAGASLSIPMVIGSLVDEGFLADNANLVADFAPVIIVVALVLAVSTGARFYFVSALGERVVTDIRKAVFDHLLKLDAGFFDVNRTGELISRLTADTTLIRSAVGSSASMALRSVVLLIGSMIMMIVSSPFLGLAIILVIPLVVIPLYLFGHRVRRLSRKSQDSVADLSAMATESLGAVKIVQSYGREPHEKKRYAGFAEDSYRTAVRRVFARSTLTSVVIFTVSMSLAGLVWFGSEAVKDGAVSVGTLSQFVLYAFLAAGALGTLAEVWGELQAVAGATERIVELLGTVPKIVSSAKPKLVPDKAQGQVRFDNVRFAYPSRPDEMVLKGVDFEINPGETLAFVGESGAGKSTLFGLAQRFYDTADGEVLVNGVNVREAALGRLRGLFAYVAQESVLFSGSIADNIRFGKTEASFDDVVRAAKAAHVDDFVAELKDGYDTWVGERGIMLSGGQKQRLCIARALLHDAPILLLDEATSALDAQSEVLVQRALDELMKGRTTLVIAHRLSTIKNADRIAVMDKGIITDIGDHAYLMAHSEVYQKLVHLQLGEPGLNQVSS